MDDGARWHKVYARGDPFNADDDGSAQHFRLWPSSSSKSSIITIRHPRGCYVPGLNDTFKAPFALAVQLYAVLELARDRVASQKTEQMKRGNAHVFIFACYFLELLKLYLRTADMAPPCHRHHHQYIPAISIWVTHPCALGSVVTGVIQLSSLKRGFEICLNRVSRGKIRQYHVLHLTRTGTAEF